MKSLFDMFEMHLQGMVNTSIAGVLSRLDALEKKSSGDDNIKINEIKDLIATAFEDFDVLDALANSHRLEEFLEENIELDDYVTKQDLHDNVKECIDNMTFEVTVR